MNDQTQDAPQPEEVVLVSACLLGEPCRYDGGSRPSNRVLEALNGKVAVVPICPEAAGGLGIPRPPAELRRGDGAEVLAGRARAIQTTGGREVTRAFLQGAELALEAAKRFGATRAILKERSPSCGSRKVWVDGKLCDGEGITCAALRGAGIHVQSDEEV